MLVISAHAADFVWRAGGAVALAAARGERVKVLCLTYGERGESASAWRAGKTLEEIKALRRAEAENAAGALGAEIEFLDAGDYPLRESDELTDRIVGVYREVNPSVVLTHPLADPYNGDHPAAAQLALRARVLAQAIGYPAAGEPIGAPPVFLSTSRRSSRPSARRWSAWPPSSTCGSTTRTWLNDVAHSSSGTPGPTWGCPNPPWARPI
jgi:4-oxalomesaconate hydratase